MISIFKICNELIEKCPQKTLSDDELEMYSREYSSKCNLSLGYYSASKADLFCRGIIRGRLVSKKSKMFSGYEYYFDSHHSMVYSKCYRDGELKAVFISENKDDMLYFYEYELLSLSDGSISILPHRIYIDKYEDNVVVNHLVITALFTSTRSERVLKGAYLEEETFEYSDRKLCAITYRTSNVDFETNTEQVLPIERFDTYNGKYWV